MKNRISIVLPLLCLVTALCFQNATAQVSSPIDRIQRNGGIVQVRSDGSIAITPKAGKGTGIKSLNSCQDAGATDAYACSLSPAPTAYATEQPIWFKANTANTGAATLNLNALGAKTIKKPVGGVTTDLSDNDIRAGQWVSVIYDGTNFQMQSQLGNAGAGTGDALVANPLSQFAPTTSDQLRTTLTNPTGTGSAVFNTDPRFSGVGIFGHTTSVGRLGQSLEVTTGANYGGIAVSTYSTLAGESGILDFNRSKSATKGTQTVVASGDFLGRIVFSGSDGTGGFINGAAIMATVDGTPGTNDMPGRLSFLTTPDGSSSVQYRFHITPPGHFIADIDNSYDIGASGATRPRTGYFGTAVVAPQFGVNTSNLNTVPTVNGDTFTLNAAAQTLNNKTLVTPTIASFANAAHDHSNAAGGSQLNATTAFGSGTVPTARLGSGTPNSSNFLRGDQTYAVPTAGAGGSTTELQRNNAGALGGISGATSDGTNVTYGSTNLRATRPRFITSIDDTNGNELIQLTAVASPVNQVDVSGGATGTGPTLAATGDDTNVDLNLSAKGTGSIKSTSNISTTGSLSTGVGGSVAGTFGLGEGTAPSLTADVFKVYAPADVAAGGLAYVVPGAAASGLMRASNSGGVMTITHDGESATKTFTNTTIDAEGTGNVITIPYFVEFRAAGTNAGTGATMLNLPSSNAPAPGSIAGTNTLNATLDFDAATDESAQGDFWIPDDWTGNIDLTVDAFANETGTNVARLSIQTICIAAGETFDPAFNTAQTFNWTNTGTNQRVVATQTSLTVTGCAAGERLFFKFLRDADGTSGTDSLGVDLRVIALRFKMRSAL